MIGIITVLGLLGLGIILLLFNQIVCKDKETTTYVIGIISIFISIVIIILGALCYMTTAGKVNDYEKLKMEYNQSLKYGSIPPSLMGKVNETNADILSSRSWN